MPLRARRGRGCAGAAHAFESGAFAPRTPGSHTSGPGAASAVGHGTDAFDRHGC